MKQTSKLMFIMLLFILSGCTYQGNLRSDIYKTNKAISPLPIKAQMVWDSGLDSGKYTSGNIYENYNVEITTNPGLKIAFQNAMAEVFENVSIIDNISKIKANEYRIILYPKIEVRSQEVFMRVTAKDSETDELIDKYEASGNVKIDNPSSAKVLSVINIIPCALLCTPFIAPAINSIVGAKHQEDFEARVVENLKNIVNEMKMDRKLKTKYTSTNK